jgi:putative phosphoribosyl transferase
LLASSLKKYRNRSDVLVLALPRGGVPVAFEVAQALHAPLDVLVVRKLGVPGNEELAFGALAPDGVRVLNAALLSEFSIADEVVNAICAREHEELRRREQVYRGSRPQCEIAGRAVILVDDGLATGSSMLAAARALRRQAPRECVIAVPVASAEACADLRSEADKVVCGAIPHPFLSVSRWYKDFTGVTDDEVLQLLSLAERRPL